MGRFELVGVFGAKDQHTGQATLAEVKAQAGLGADPIGAVAIDDFAVGLDLAERDLADRHVAPLGAVLTVAEPGFIDNYLTQGRNVPIRQVTLRQVQPDSEIIYGDSADWIRSEACLRLDLGEGRLPGMLVFGSEDPHQFKPTHGTDLLTFFAGVFERAMRRWLS